MSIKITDEPDIYITSAERDQLWREWQEAMGNTTEQVSFETYVRRRKEGGAKYRDACGNFNDRREKA